MPLGPYSSYYTREFKIINKSEITAKIKIAMSYISEEKDKISKKAHYS